MFEIKAAIKAVLTTVFLFVYKHNLPVKNDDKAFVRKNIAPIVPNSRLVNLNFALIIHLENLKLMKQYLFLKQFS